MQTMTEHLVAAQSAAVIPARTGKNFRAAFRLLTGYVMDAQSARGLADLDVTERQQSRLDWIGDQKRLGWVLDATACY